MHASQTDIIIRKSPHPQEPQEYDKGKQGSALSESPVPTHRVRTGKTAAKQNRSPSERGSLQCEKTSHSLQHTLRTLGAQTSAQKQSASPEDARQAHKGTGQRGGLSQYAAPQHAAANHSLTAPPLGWLPSCASAFLPNASLSPPSASRPADFCLNQVNAMRTTRVTQSSQSRRREAHCFALSARPPVLFATAYCMRTTADYAALACT
eukprot:633329-Prorocentrum_minimum.AAC.1